MGGYNSGSNQWRSRYGLADMTWSLDVMTLHRAGWLELGHWGTFRPGLNLLAKQDQLTLMYDARFEDGTCKPIGETIDIVHSSRHFGGSVPYFICPGERCGRRVAKLYQNTGRFRCRRCSRLAYESQYVGWIDRMIWRRDKIARRLGIDQTNSVEDARRPKHMRRKTYKNLINKLRDIEQRFGT